MQQTPSKLMRISALLLFACSAGCSVESSPTDGSENEVRGREVLPDRENRYSQIGHIRSVIFSKGYLRDCSATYLRFPETDIERSYLATAAHCILPKANAPLSERYRAGKTTLSFSPSSRNPPHFEVEWAYAYPTTISHMRYVDKGRQSVPTQWDPETDLAAVFSADSTDQWPEALPVIQEQLTLQRWLNSAREEIQKLPNENINFRQVGNLSEYQALHETKAPRRVLAYEIRDTNILSLTTRLQSPKFTIVGYGGRDTTRNFGPSWLAEYVPYRPFNPEDWFSKPQYSVTVVGRSGGGSSIIEGGDSGGAIISDGGELVAIISSGTYDSTARALPGTQHFFEITGQTRDHCLALDQTECTNEMPLCIWEPQQDSAAACQLNPHSARAWQPAQEYCGGHNKDACLKNKRCTFSLEKKCILSLREDRVQVPFAPDTCTFNLTAQSIKERIICDEPWPLAGESYSVFFGPNQLPVDAENALAVPVYVLELDQPLSAAGTFTKLEHLSQLPGYAGWDQSQPYPYEGFMLRPLRETTSIVLVLSKRVEDAFYDPEVRTTIESAFQRQLSGRSPTETTRLVQILRAQHQQSAFGEVRR